MSPPRLILFALLLLPALATTASAQRTPAARAVTSVASPDVEQAIYKGIVGNVLDAIPMDPSKRVDLQRANAIISNTASARSLAVLAGLSNPVLLIAGLVWGMWSASNIKPAEADTKVTADSGVSGRDATAEARVAALVTPAAAVDDAPAKSAHEPILLSSNSAGFIDEAAFPRPPIIKIWLPQRSATLP